MGVNKDYSNSGLCVVIVATCCGVSSNEMTTREDSFSEFEYSSPDDTPPKYSVTQDIKFGDFISDGDDAFQFESDTTKDKDVSDSETMALDYVTEQDTPSDSSFDGETTTEDLEETTIDNMTESKNDLFSAYGYPMPGDIPILNRKIYRGARVSILEFPYVASIRRMNAHYLTGSLVSENVVITVAHPLYQVPTWELSLVAGENYSDRGTMQHTVLFVVVHQDFDPFTLVADLALLRVYEIIKLMPNRKLVPIYSAQKSSPNNETRKDEEYLAYVTGWGRCDYTGKELCMPRSSVYYPDEKQDPMLRTITFKYVTPENNHYCTGYDRHQVPVRAGMLCAGVAREEQPTAPCLAVPGAPLVLQGWLLGAQSWGFGCGFWHDLPLIYTDFNYYEKWIRHNLRVISKIEEDHFEELYIATKAYIMMEWMLRTRQDAPEKRYSSEHELKFSNIDHKLINLIGNVTDFRDYFEGGIGRYAKQQLYKTMKIQSLKENEFKNISATYKLREAQPFLDEGARDEAAADEAPGGGGDEDQWI